MTQRPLFSHKLDADPLVRAWLAGLDEATRRKLRDDVTPHFKERPFDASEADRLPHVPVTPSDAVHLDEEHLAAIREAALEVADNVLPDWQREPFRRWMARQNRNAIARTLGVSRATVRAAIDGQAHRTPGALARLVDVLTHDPEFIAMAKQTIEAAAQPTAREVALVWFKGIHNKPELFAAWSFLWVLHAMANARREVPVADLLPVVPRAIISPLLAQLKAHGMAASDGKTITIHRTPA